MSNIKKHQKDNKNVRRATKMLTMAEWKNLKTISDEQQRISHPYIRRASLHQVMSLKITTNNRYKKHRRIPRGFLLIRLNSRMYLLKMKLDRANSSHKLWHFKLTGIRDLLKMKVKSRILFQRCKYLGLRNRTLFLWIPSCLLCRQSLNLTFSRI